MLLTSLLVVPVLLQQERELDPAELALQKISRQYRRAEAIGFRGTFEIFNPGPESEEDVWRETGPELISMGMIEMTARFARPRLGSLRFVGEMNGGGGTRGVDREMIGGAQGLFSLNHLERSYLAVDDFDDRNHPHSVLALVAPLAVWFDMMSPGEAKPVLLDTSEAPQGHVGIRLSDDYLRREYWVGPKGMLRSATVKMRDEDGIFQRFEFRFTDFQLHEKADAAGYAKELPKGYSAEEVYDEIYAEAEAEIPDFETSLLAVGAAAPAVKMTDMSGEEVSLASLKGKTVLLNFWFYH